MRGLSFVLAFGKYGGFYGHVHSHSWRLCLGWVAFTIYPRTDIEAFIQHLRRKASPQALEDTKPPSFDRQAAQELSKAIREGRYVSGVHGVKIVTAPKPSKDNLTEQEQEND